MKDHPLVCEFQPPHDLNDLLYYRDKTKFTTGDDNHVGDDYFLTSGDKVRYFLEEDAVDQNGNLTKEKHRAVNKIGHGKIVR